MIGDFVGGRDVLVRLVGANQTGTGCVIGMIGRYLDRVGGSKSGINSLAKFQS